MVEIRSNSYGNPNNGTYSLTTLPPLESGIKNTIMKDRYPDATERTQFRNNSSSRYSNDYSTSSVGTSSFYVNYEQEHCNKYVAHLTQDETVQYFQRFKTNYDYSTILYSGNKRSIGSVTNGLKASPTEETNINFRKYKMAFLPDHSDDRDNYGASYKMRGKFKNETELNNYNSSASGVQVFKDFKFKASIDGVAIPTEKSVDLEYCGISGSVTKTTYLTRQAAIDDNALFDIDIEQRGSVVNPDFFDPNITNPNNNNRGPSGDDDYTTPNGNTPDPDSTTSPPPTTPPPPSATTTSAPSATTTAEPTGTETTAPAPTAPAQPPYSSPTTMAPPISCS